LGGCGPRGTVKAVIVWDMVGGVGGVGGVDGVDGVVVANGG
jgi:hypothetical protein